MQFVFRGRMVELLDDESGQAPFRVTDTARWWIQNGEEKSGEASVLVRDKLCWTTDECADLFVEWQGDLTTIPSHGWNGEPVPDWLLEGRLEG